MGAWLQPPVSATNDLVFFRDGDNKIRYLSPDGRKGDATTVPGGSSTISFFSVSPDDQRIAVLVEDRSRSDVISLRLYVEDLNGGGHHNDIYSTTFPQGRSGFALWPMSWHQGRLMLAVWPACTFEPIQSPSAWHVVDAATAVRLATIGDTNCIPVSWPSPAGAACDDYNAGQARIYDWSGKLNASVATQNLGRVGGLSPSGQRISLINGGGLGDPAPVTRILNVDGSASVTIPGHLACLWIDENTVLAPDALIAYPSGRVTPLAASGACAGRFPDGL